jgi:DNA-binding NarL/FixJ family response regulator
MAHRGKSYRPQAVEPNGATAPFGSGFKSSVGEGSPAALRLCTCRCVSVNKKIRVLIIDDHELVRQELVTNLGRDRELEVVGDTGDREVATRWAEERGADVILLDVRREDKGGVELVRRLSERGNDCVVLILTSYVSRDEWLEAEQAGARACVLKQIDSKGLVDKIKALAHAS